MAYEYAISFEIKADSTYSDRYKSLMEEIRKTPGNPAVWAETTSFVLLRSDEKIDDLEHRLYFKTKLNSQTDILRDPFTNKPYVHFYATKRVGGQVVNSEAIKLLKFI